MIQMNDIKLYLINSTVFAISMSDTIVDLLRITLLVVTIIYTILKIRKIYGKKN
tara:strand:+ start:25654 stop:25815 length:162 start_codon:yes stop_codon:yes gene_type:complete